MKLGDDELRSRIDGKEQEMQTRKHWNSFGFRVYKMVVRVVLDSAL